MSQILPSVVLVGRPNVGKSTLFNRLTRSRDAIVADMPGLTRDRHFGIGRVGDLPYLVVDTGGFEPLIKDGILREMAKQTEMAIAEADSIIFVVDAKSGLTPHDKEIANLLRRCVCPVRVAVNKAEGNAITALAEFHELGLSQLLAISASHGDGVNLLMENVLADLPKPTHFNPSENLNSEEKVKFPATPKYHKSQQNHPIRVAIVGRPNVGKSTFINSLLGEERLIAFDQAGTTRDAISVDFTLNNNVYTLVDTAGIRKKGKVFAAVEKFSVIKTLQAIEASNVTVLMLDAHQDVAVQDASIADFIIEQGRALVVAVNKWDQLASYEREQIKITLARKLRFLDFAKIHFISAKEGSGLKAVFRSVDSAYAAAMKKLPTPQLTRVLHEAVARQTPKRHGMSRPKPRYAHQGGQNPPIIVIHGTGVEHLDNAYHRFLLGVFRQAFSLEGTPVRLQFVGTENPHVKEK